MATRLIKLALPLTFFALVGLSCGDDVRDDDGGNAAIRRGVGAACANTNDCEEQGQTCLTFKGGYCGVRDCMTDVDCPSGSACVTHDDGVNYCFLVCVDKPECNVHRPVEDESNCVSSITFADPDSSGGKACVPPTG